MSDSFKEKVWALIKQYRRSLENIGFAEYELQRLRGTPETEEELLEMLDVIVQSGKELNYIFEEAPNSFFVCDKDGVSIRVNKAFEKMVHLTRHDVYGKNTKDLDAASIFKPSVCQLALKEKRSVSVLQELNHVRNIVVTGVPVFDEYGNLFRVFTNAIKVDDLEPMQEYIMKTMNAPTGESTRKHIVASGEKMKEVLALADMVKNTESNVLITGETGVGKGMLASYIHDTSIRSEGRLVNINCGAIPENLLESELFGYVSGAFTGADRKGKPGLIEMSDGGTLFLDEISELPLMMQVKILHFLQTKKITRVGSTEEIYINARIIAASNKSLEKEVRTGRFRADLYYRINVIPIEIPPLRERREDLKTLTNHFLNTYMEKYNKSVHVDEDTMNFIMHHEWKGNVRELENYIERLVVTNDSGWILSIEEQIEQEAGNGAAGTPKPMRMSKENEKELILQAYTEHKSSYKVAEVLGMSQSTAYRKIRKYLGESQKKEKLSYENKRSQIKGKNGSHQ